MRYSKYGRIITALLLIFICVILTGCTILDSEHAATRNTINLLLNRYGDQNFQVESMRRTRTDTGGIPDIPRRYWEIKISSDLSAEHFVVRYFNYIENILADEIILNDVKLLYVLHQELFGMYYEGQGRSAVLRINYLDPNETDTNLTLMRATIDRPHNSVRINVGRAQRLYDLDDILNKR